MDPKRERNACRNKPRKTSWCENDYFAHQQQLQASTATALAALPNRDHAASFATKASSSTSHFLSFLLTSEVKNELHFLSLSLSSVTLEPESWSSSSSLPLWAEASWSGAATSVCPSCRRTDTHAQDLQLKPVAASRLPSLGASEPRSRAQPNATAGRQPDALVLLTS